MGSDDSKLLGQALELRSAVEYLIDKANDITAAHRQELPIPGEYFEQLYTAQYELEIILARPIKAAMMKALSEPSE